MAEGQEKGNEVSLLAVAARLRATAMSLGNTQALLQQAGTQVLREIKTNIDKGQVAGEYRPDTDTSGAPPGGGMTPLAKYTLDRRNAAGPSHPDPLKDSGRLYNEIGIRISSPTRVVVGGMTPYARKMLLKHMGTDISFITSTDLDRMVPYRSPVGYSAKVMSQLLSLWANAFAVGSNVSGSAKYEIRL